MKRIRRSELCGFAILIALSAATAAADDFAITPTFTDTFRWSVQIGSAAAEINPPLYLARGQSYSFAVSTTGSHPFYIKTANSTGTANAYVSGSLSDNAVTTSETVTFDVPQDAPDLLFYNCGVHASMAGAIDIVVFRDGFGD